MPTRITAGLLAVAAGVGLAAGQPADPAPVPKLLYGHDLKVRPGGEKELARAAAVPVELFRCEAAGADGQPAAFAVAVTGTGYIAALPDGPVGGDKRVRRLAAHDVRPRKPTEPEVTQKTKAWGVELFHDLGTNRLLYVTEGGAVASAPVPPALLTDKGLPRVYGMNLKVRAPGEETFDKAKKVGVDVFKDENTGGRVYVSDAGAVAAAPAPAAAAAPKKGAGPTSAYGLDLRVRAAGEKSFEKAKKVGVEVYQDPDGDALVYVTEAGAVAVAPNPGKLAEVRRAGEEKSDLPPAVTSGGGMSLQVRKPGGADFDGAAKFGVELFRDNRTGNLILVSETGAIAVLPK